MPTYEYRCDECGERHEVVQSFQDDPLTVCPACGGPLRKVFGAIGVVFKGSGFYKTDSRSTGGKGAAKDGERAVSKDGERAAGKEDKKPAAETSSPSTSDTGGSSAPATKPSKDSSSSSKAAAAAS